MSNSAQYPMKVSVVIKALNEEKKIAKAIQSSIDAVASVGGEVILADSCSTDRTIEIASQFDIKIVQLAKPEERCCGIGPQLGYQFSQGEFVYILDGDMEFLPGFLQQAVSYLESHPEVGGVGGVIQEMNTDSLEYISRMERASGHMQPGVVDRLDMGGLYRRSAVEQVGYFSNKNLHSYEEYDLAIRLRTAGYTLYRLDVVSVRHFGHDAGPYELLFRRWKTGYIFGLGEMLRAAINQPHFKLLISEVRELKIYLATLLWLALQMTFLLMNVLHLMPWIVSLALFSMPFVLMTLKKRSFAKAMFSVVSWLFNSIGLLRGFFMHKPNAKQEVAMIVVQ